MDLTAQRLQNQGLVNSQFTSTHQVVQWLGAVQAQDYAGAKWAIGLRLPHSTDADIETEIASGTILRTHLLRPTWHFVAAEDIRWMLALTAPRVNALCATYYRKLGLDERIFAEAEKIFQKVMKGGKQLMRTELRAALTKAGINLEGMRFVFILMHAELAGVICSGARRGKQFTYALLEERVPKVTKLSEQEALATLVLRYFSSHGPATVHDFVWWSGLKVADAKKGLALLTLQSKEIDGKVYWYAREHAEKSSGVFLLPNYDEYLSYKDRSVYFLGKVNPLLINHIVVKNGKIVGNWKRKEAGIINLSELSAVEIAAQTRRYAEFVGKKVEVMN